MRLRPLLVFCCAALAAAPLPASAWGAQGHRIVNGAAVRALPDTLPAFLRSAGAHDEIALLGPEADRVKGAGAPLDDDDNPGHYVDALDDLTVAGVVKLSALPKDRAEYDRALRGAPADRPVRTRLSAVPDRRRLAADRARSRVLARRRRRRDRRRATPEERAFFAFDRGVREAVTLARHRLLGALRRRRLAAAARQRALQRLEQRKSIRTRTTSPTRARSTRASRRRWCAPSRPKISSRRACRRSRAVERSGPGASRRVPRRDGERKVPDVYRLEAAGGIDGRSAAAKALVLDRLAAGAAEMRDLHRRSVAGQRRCEGRLSGELGARRRVRCGRADPRERRSGRLAPRSYVVCERASFGIRAPGTNRGVVMNTTSQEHAREAQDPRSRALRARRTRRPRRCDARGERADAAPGPPCRRTAPGPGMYGDRMPASDAEFVRALDAGEHLRARHREVRRQPHQGSGGARVRAAHDRRPQHRGGAARSRNARHEPAPGAARRRGSNGHGPARAGACCRADSGPQMDSDFMRMQVPAHRRALGLLQWETQNGRTPASRRSPTKLTPTVQQHLQIAQSYLAAHNLTPYAPPDVRAPSRATRTPATGRRTGPGHAEQPGLAAERRLDVRQEQRHRRDHRQPRRRADVRAAGLRDAAARDRNGRPRPRRLPRRRCTRSTHHRAAEEAPFAGRLFAFLTFVMPSG